MMVSCGFPLRGSESCFCGEERREELTVIGDDFYSIVLPNANASFGRVIRGRN